MGSFRRTRVPKARRSSRDVIPSLLSSGHRETDTGNPTHTRAYRAPRALSARRLRGRCARAPFCPAPPLNFYVWHARVRPPLADDDTKEPSPPFDSCLVVCQRTTIPSGIRGVTPTLVYAPNFYWSMRAVNNTGVRIRAESSLGTQPPDTPTSPFAVAH